MNSEQQYWDKITDLRHDLKNTEINFWLEHSIFSFPWFFIIFIIIISAIIWWVLIDKKRLIELIAFGGLVALLATIFDIIGSNFVLFGYPTELLPIIPPLIPANLAVIPFTFILIYQYTNSWKSFLITVLIIGGMFAFIFEPILDWINIYEKCSGIHFTHSLSI
ncbi:CBO0543 family protein [Alkalibacillus haloalkaliphilus]|uniref:CBO0543 family protein n=1 Tax=Alkalibacillus haloalkaliphilus TaxID=94136 RepID=UPI0002E2A332|nr:CBO0543 family protein [Alkalibacillus haloalkaliphilus]